MVVVDVLFKNDWTIPEDKNIKTIKGKDDLNYYMVCSEVEGIGLDDLLDYVDKVIKLNLEREEKHDLLRKKIGELTELFKKNPLAKLIKLKFTFGETDYVPNINALDEPPIISSPHQREMEEMVIPINAYLDENGNPIELSEEDKEAILEEQRAARNLKQRPKSNMVSKVELPPRGQKQVMEINPETGCACGPNEACDKCIDSKY
jgi:hypothetical protein